MISSAMLEKWRRSASDIAGLLNPSNDTKASVSWALLLEDVVVSLTWSAFKYRGYFLVKDDEAFSLIGLYFFSS